MPINSLSELFMGQAGRERLKRDNINKILADSYESPTPAYMTPGTSGSEYDEGNPIAAKPGGLNWANAMTSMYKGGYGADALNLQMAQDASNKELKKTYLEHQLKNQENENMYKRGTDLLDKLRGGGSGKGYGVAVDIDPVKGPIIKFDPTADPKIMAEKWKTYHETGVWPDDTGSPGTAPGTPGFNPAPGAGAIPPVRNNRFPGMTPKDASAAAKAEREASIKTLDKESEDQANLTNVLTDLNRWGDLNKAVETGPIAGRRMFSLDPKFQELKTIENRLSMNNFKPGQGAMSNFERSLIKGAGPNTTNDFQTNENIRNIWTGAVQTSQDRTQFRQSYLQSQGNLLGADKAWNDYVENQPKFIQDQSGNVVPNSSRVPWQQYFQMKSQGKATNNSQRPPLKIF
jgi:hypothetical protein